MGKHKIHPPLYFEHLGKLFVIAAYVVWEPSQQWFEKLNLFDKVGSLLILLKLRKLSYECDILIRRILCNVRDSSFDISRYAQWNIWGALIHGFQRFAIALYSFDNNRSFSQPLYAISKGYWTYVRDGALSNQVGLNTAYVRRHVVSEISYQFEVIYTYWSVHTSRLVGLTVQQSPLRVEDLVEPLRRMQFALLGVENRLLFHTMQETWLCQIFFCDQKGLSQST